jgi:hypothetical protein
VSYREMKKKKTDDYTAIGRFWRKTIMKNLNYVLLLL